MIIYFPEDPFKEGDDDDDDDMDGPVEIGELAAQLAHVVRHAETVRHLERDHGEAQLGS